jgi:hypothetical protein
LRPGPPAAPGATTEPDNSDDAGTDDIRSEGGDSESVSLASSASPEKEVEADGSDGNVDEEAADFEFRPFGDVDVEKPEVEEEIDADLLNTEIDNSQYEGGTGDIMAELGSMEIGTTPAEEAALAEEDQEYEEMEATFDPKDDAEVEVVKTRGQKLLGIGSAAATIQATVPGVPQRYARHAALTFSLEDAITLAFAQHATSTQVKLPLDYDFKQCEAWDQIPSGMVAQARASLRNYMQGSVGTDIAALSDEEIKEVKERCAVIKMLLSKPHDVDALPSLINKGLMRTPAM